MEKCPNILLQALDRIAFRSKPFAFFKAGDLRDVEDASRRLPVYHLGANMTLLKEPADYP